MTRIIPQHKKKFPFGKVFKVQFLFAEIASCGE